ncbi:MAG: peptide chain release factor-like protein [Syntrophales bacterium]|jgi:protein subunit release factor B|nr:peptide chain release factor-like protein [Syntrophales bacterium]MDY0043756.1 peptide chain release factor-like protein [Syntrophales bacterium]
MGIFTVSPEKEKALLEKMSQLGIREEDIREIFIRASGAGGQKVNKTSSCVQLIHLPTGISVKCQRERSQSLNRFLARRLLAERIERIQKGIKSQEKKRIEKLRRQKRRRSKRAKEKILQLKHRQSEKKGLREKITTPPEE